MRKLWQTAAGPDAAVEAYTAGEDCELDRRLLPYEVYGSIAHAEGLARAGVLTPRELSRLRAGLRGLLEEAKIFRISRAQEDVHTAVEQALVRRLGAVGLKIHAGRSRNDQVQTDLRLYLKDALLSLSLSALEAAAAWEAFGRRRGRALMPGYTHLQRAMPTTVGHWAASHAEALVEGARGLRGAYEAADSCPLGSASGFGAHLPLDRERTARRLGFSRVQRNTLRVQSSRPGIEAAAVCALALLARDLGVLAWDLSLFLSAEFGFLKLSPAFTTGSSLMPQKRNPDPVELTRARAALFPGWAAQILSLGRLPSGYHRDHQLTKAPLFAALDSAAAMLDMAGRLPAQLTVDSGRCAAAVTSDMLATQRALDLVKRGVAFREAYREVAVKARLEQGPPGAAEGVELPDYPGAPGRPDWAGAAADRRAAGRWSLGEHRRLRAAWAALLKG